MDNSLRIPTGISVLIPGEEEIVCSLEELDIYTQGLDIPLEQLDKVRFGHQKYISEQVSLKPLYFP